jgi:hypothetical protein
MALLPWVPTGIKPKFRVLRIIRKALDKEAAHVIIQEAGKLKKKTRPPTPHLFSLHFVEVPEAGVMYGIYKVAPDVGPEVAPEVGPEVATEVVPEVAPEVALKWVLT